MRRRRRAARGANIVEGASRKGRNEFRHFLDIALGYLCELEYALEVTEALEYLKPETVSELLARQRRARFFTWKLKQSMLHLAAASFAADFQSSGPNVLRLGPDQMVLTVLFDHMRAPPRDSSAGKDRDE